MSNFTQSESSLRSIPASIRVRSIFETEGERDGNELLVFGQYAYSSDRIMILYEEFMEKGEPSVQTLISVLNGNVVSIHRSGYVDSLMLFEQGKRHQTSYQLPFGEMQVNSYTLSLQNALTPKGGTLSIAYSLDLNSAAETLNTITITVVPQNNSPTDEPLNIGKEFPT